MAIMVIESQNEEFIEDSVCIHGELLRYNKTMLRQVWNIDNPLVIGDHSAVIELPTIEQEAGIWNVQSPLGGKLIIIPFKIFSQHITVTILLQET